ncbi:pyridoxamine 5'-phosphate oxidase family protein [Mycetocola zhujimingii]|nr:pyridoxamine 5'-phosphate oxidase family protein [Mycetocola zhujimingii]
MTLNNPFDSTRAGHSATPGSPGTTGPTGEPVGTSPDTVNTASGRTDAAHGADTIPDPHDTAEVTTTTAEGLIDAGISDAVTAPSTEEETTDPSSPEFHAAEDDDMVTIARLVKASKIALLTTVTPSGQLHSRPLATQESDFDGDLWFFTQDPSSKVDDIRSNDQVNAAFESGKGYLSISGSATLVHDRDKINELWSPALEAWFPDGKDDPTVALIKVSAQSAEYWATNEPGVVTMFKIAKAVVTGSQPDIGDNKSVDL